MRRALVIVLVFVAACQFDQSGVADSTGGSDAELGVDAGSGGADADVTPRAIRVATANLRCLIDDWDRRVRAIAADVVNLAPEVIALQEVCVDQGGRDSLGDLLWEIEQAGGPRYQAVRGATHWAWDQYEEGIAVATRVPILDQRVVDLPKGVFPRKAVVVRVQSSTGPLVFAGTHLSFGGEQNLVRHSQLGEVRNAVAAMRQTGDAVAIAGDFNETPGSLAVSAALSAGYADVWATAMPSDPGPTVPSDAPEARIDFVLTNGLDTMAAGQFMDAPYQGIWPSDHRGVWAEVIAAE